MRALLAALAILGAGCPPQQGVLCRPAYAFYDCRFHDNGKDAACFYDGRNGTLCAFPDRDCPSGYRWSEFALYHSCDCVAPEHVTMDGGAGDR